MQVTAQKTKIITTTYRYRIPPADQASGNLPSELYNDGSIGSRYNMDTYLLMVGLKPGNPSKDT